MLTQGYIAVMSAGDVVVVTYGGYFAGIINHKTNKMENTLQQQAENTAEVMNTEESTTQGETIVFEEETTEEDSAEGTDEAEELSEEVEETTSDDEIFSQDEE